MSTRASILVTDGQDRQWFYRHSDGYPSGALPPLVKFMKWIFEGKIRDDVEQSAGWLVLLGARESDSVYIGDGKSEKKTDLTEPSGGSMGWKYGSMEICPHGTKKDSGHDDIEWQYVVNVKDKTISVQELGSGKPKTFGIDEIVQGIDTKQFEAPKKDASVDVKGIKLTREEYESFVEYLNENDVQDFTKDDVENWLREYSEYGVPELLGRNMSIATGIGIMFAPFIYFMVKKKGGQ